LWTRILHSAPNLYSLLVENRNKIRREGGALRKEAKILMPIGDELGYVRVLRDLKPELNPDVLVPMKFITDFHSALPVLDVKFKRTCRFWDR
jgi:hypothetical protein